MRVTEEEVILIVLAEALKTKKNRDRSSTEITLGCKDATNEILSAANKMSKSDMIDEINAPDGHL